MFPQCDVKAKRVPKQYPTFGEKLFSLVVDNLPNEFSKDKHGVVSYFQRQPEFGFDTTCTYAWLRGDVAGTKPLVLDNFKRILRFYIGKKGLCTIEDIHQWIASGPPRYEDVLGSDEIQSLLLQKNILKPNIEQNEELAERQKIWARLNHLVQVASLQEGGNYRKPGDSSADPNLIIIQGPPGVGKTMLLERLQSDPGIQARFDEVFFASCDAHTSLQTFIDFWVRKIIPDQADYPEHPAMLKTEMRKAVRGRRVLLLADNLSSPEEIKVLKRFCELGCVLVITTRSLDVARQAAFSQVVEITAYSKSDVVEYFSKNYATQPSAFTQEKLLQLAQMVCYNPLGLNIALRRVAEEGWESVMKKVRLAPAVSKSDVFEDLHKPLWLAYDALSSEDQERFRRLGILPNLASYDEDRLGLLWGVSKTRANEILVRFEKEAGLARYCRQKNGHWHFHPQVLNYARCFLNNNTRTVRLRARLYLVRLALFEKRPCHFSHLYKRGVKSEVVRKYWQMIREERKRRRLPIFLAELRRLVDLTYSKDWSIFIQLTSNCSLADYIWGYRNYLEGMIDVLFFFVHLFLIGIFGGFQKLVLLDGILKRNLTLYGIFNFCLLVSVLIWILHLIFRELRRQYDWAQLWHKVTSNLNDIEIEE